MSTERNRQNDRQGREDANRRLRPNNNSRWDRDHALISSPPPFESRGIEAYEQTWILFFGSSLSTPVFDIHRLDVVAGTDVALAIAHMRCAYLEKVVPPTWISD